MKYLRLLAVLTISLLGIFYCNGILASIFFASTILSLLYALIFVKNHFFPHKNLAYKKIILLFSSLLISFVLTETILAILELRNQKPTKKALTKTGGMFYGGKIQLKIPKELDKRQVHIPGALRSYYWHNKLHVFNQDHMRRTTPFPKKRENTFRIMVLGDSMTYGQGVKESETYSNILQDHLQKEFDIEILNLGVCGHGSEDILHELKKFTPTLIPDLIIYGICTNDFNPSQKMVKVTNQKKFHIPISFSTKKFLIDKFRTAKLLKKMYAKLMLISGIHVSYKKEIKTNFVQKKSRFEEDLIKMSQYVKSKKLPPIITMVLTPLPKFPLDKLIKSAEEIAERAGMTLIPSKNYNQKYSNHNFAVSEWDGHPNVKAHQIFANNLYQHIRKRDDIKAFLKP